MDKRIAVLGAGPMGLVSLKYLLKKKCHHFCD